VIYSKLRPTHASAPRGAPIPRQWTQPEIVPAHEGAGIIEKILWLWTMIGGLTSTGLLLYTFTKAQSAPQQAAGAAMAVAVVAVPYCLARAVQLYKR
jgi:hypothetical protein